jgi:hypothetical protein
MHQPASKTLDEFYSSKQFKHLQEMKSIHTMADGDLREMFSFKKYAADFQNIGKSYKKV